MSTVARRPGRPNGSPQCPVRLRWSRPNPTESGSQAAASGIDAYAMRTPSEAESDAPAAKYSVGAGARRPVATSHAVTATARAAAETGAGLTPIASVATTQRLI